MEEVEKLYYAALEKENLTELPHGYSKTKFLELCQRSIDDNKEITFSEKIGVAHFYLRTFLKHPHDNL